MEALLVGILWLLVYAVIGAIVVYLVIWVLGQIGVDIPPIVPKLLWVVLVLIILILAVQLLLGSVPSPRLR